MNASLAQERNPDELRLLEQAVRSVKWSVLASLIPRLVTPLSTILLAAILLPDDFGTVAVSTLVVNLARIGVELGLGPAVIQRRTKVNEAASVAFWLCISIAILAYGAIWFSSPSLARLYNMPRLTGIIRVSGVALICVGFSSIPIALLQRNLDFRRLFWITSFPQIVAAIISIGWAILGGGIWALVIGPLVGETLRTLSVWRHSIWRPGLVFDARLLGEISRFSFWVVLSGVQTWLFLQADNAVAGLFLSAHDLGIYSLGFNIGTLFPGLIVASLSVIAYPVFCSLHEAQIGPSLVKLQTLAASVLFPIVFGISAVSGPAALLIYGERWDGLGTVTSILVIMPGLSNLWSLNSDSYRALGRPDMWVKIAFLSLTGLFPILLITGPMGVIPFTLGRFAGSILLPVVNVAIGARLLGLSVQEQLTPLVSPFISALLMFVIVFAGSELLWPFVGVVGWLKLLCLMGFGSLIYCIFLSKLNRSLSLDLLHAFRRIMSSA